MKRLFVFLVSLAFISCINAQDLKKEDATPALDSTCISMQELELYRLINEYRQDSGLRIIPLSKQLTYVAQLHCRDLSEHYKIEESCNLHSWSESERWSSCCYTPDHKHARCMWDKPRELTHYYGDGYEIAFYTNIDEELGDLPKSALAHWKESSGHNNVLVNQNAFKDAKWNAVGIGIYKNFVCVWFGMVTDPFPLPELCE
ncbi:MAG: CAP domain-containing protein [Hyphomicrobiales bacterium]